MPLQELRKRSLVFYKLTSKKLDKQDNKAENKHEQTDPVNAMHVFYKACFGTVGIRLFDV